MNMTDEEALRILDSHEVFSSDAAMNAAREALREKVAKNKPKRPTLEEMESELRVPYSVATHFGGPRRYESSDREKICLSAADVLKALREVVVPRLKTLESADFRGEYRTAFSAMLQALGEDVG